MQEVTFDFRGKNFAVLGASSGMGRQIAVELAEAGANVLAIARNKNRLETLRQEGNGRIDVASLDVLSAEDAEWNRIFEDYTSRRGKLSGGVYTAGITGCTPLKAYDRKLADDLMDICLRGGGTIFTFC